MAYSLMHSTFLLTQSGGGDVAGRFEFAYFSGKVRTACTMSFSSLAGRTTVLLSSFMVVTMLLTNLYFSASCTAVSPEGAGSCF
ncbi:hypothetical protein [Marinomonas spartinae]|uniref:hypothetical protein n=1 Tax=Marinomonas spartinae TaxID=1792290 RepID=UPI001111A40D|nr:hypothetical protein [Marinomonas spartinae]